MTGKASELNKPIPHFETDEEMERFIDTADLSQYDLSAFKPMRFELNSKGPASICGCLNSSFGQ